MFKWFERPSGISQECTFTTSKKLSVYLALDISRLSSSHESCNCAKELQGCEQEPGLLHYYCI